MKFFDDFGVFLWGKFDYKKAELMAQNCDNFRLDSDYSELLLARKK
ncbi:hypothetical protein [Campylobacter gastrosuis]|uniref:Methyltransferase n=1 Tax=Campylobacter gastrosuis TaxID=2974576 RepID=A0ABT7HRT9_9BACT|nr:hypothetical protein [Campylobacter gastrosuis]MDL0089590.1 hypothetical protein [Campylobacter gastrosuis]